MMRESTTLPRREAVGLNRISAVVAPYAMTVLRVLTGITFLLNGLPKLQNVGGFAGFVGSLGFPVPIVFATLIVALEVVGGILLIVGLGTRWVSLLFVGEMIVTTLLVKSKVGFMAPQGKPGVGAELDLLLMAAALVLFAYGAGQLSIDRNLLKRDE